MAIGHLRGPIVTLIIMLRRQIRTVMGAELVPGRILIRFSMVIPTRTATLHLPTSSHMTRQDPYLQMKVMVQISGELRLIPAARTVRLTEFNQPQNRTWARYMDSMVLEVPHNSKGQF